MNTLQEEVVNAHLGEEELELKITSADLTKGLPPNYSTVDVYAYVEVPNGLLANRH